MAIYRLLQQAAFDDRAVEAMTQAYEAALLQFELANRADPLTELVAGKIIEMARTGERDPARLCELAVRKLKG